MQALVYLVEDDPDLARMLEEHLHAAGHDVESYRNGRDALEAIRRDPDRPDLVLTDFNMPGLSGLELIQQVREYNPDLYFLVITAFGTTELEEACLSSGASGFLRKPFSFHVLLAMIGKLLEEKQLPRQVRPLAEPSTLQQSDTSPSASVLPPQAFQPSPPLQEHSDLPIYPFIMGGLLHNALNALMAITSFQEDLSRKMAGSEVDRSLKASLERAVPGTKHLTILLRTMQYITHSFYDKEEKQSVHSQILETISSFVLEHPEITYYSTVSNALDHVSIPVGVCTFLAGELLKNSTKACATRPGAEIWLTIGVMERINVLSLECHDTGVGFSEDILTKIRAHELRPPKGKEVGGVWALPDSGTDLSPARRPPCCQPGNKWSPHSSAPSVDCQERRGVMDRLNRLTILIVDDQVEVLRRFRDVLQEQGHEVECASLPAEASRYVRERLFDIDLPPISWTGGYATAALASYSAGE